MIFFLVNFFGLLCLVKFFLMVFSEVLTTDLFLIEASAPV